MSFEGVTKDIKDERKPMGKGDTVLKMGGDQYSTGTGATDPELALYILLFCITWKQYSNYGICPANSLQDIRQNHWTMKYRSLTYIHVHKFRSVSH